MDDEYRPCGSCMSSRTGTLIFAWLDAILQLVSFGVVVYLHFPSSDFAGDPYVPLEILPKRHRGRMPTVGIVAVCLFVMLLSTFSALYGTLKERKSFLIPYIIVNVIDGLLSFIIMDFFAFWDLTFYVLLIVYQISKLTVVWIHYLNLNDKEQQMDVMYTKSKGKFDLR